MHIAIVRVLLLTSLLGCKPTPRVNDVFKANEETKAEGLATECRPNPNVTGDQIEVCRQSPTGLDSGSG